MPQLVPPRPFIECSFCGAHSDEREHIVAGPQVFICDECVKAAAEVIHRVDLPIEGGLYEIVAEVEVDDETGLLPDVA